MARRKIPARPRAPNLTSSDAAHDYYNDQYHQVDRRHQSTGLYADTTNTHIDRIEGLWREYAPPVSSFPGGRLIVLADLTRLLRYCGVVRIDPQHTLWKAVQGRIKNFFRWHCDHFSVRKTSSVSTYWHQLSQLYIKWKGRRMNPLLLKQIFDVEPSTDPHLSSALIRGLVH